MSARHETDAGRAYAGQRCTGNLRPAPFYLTSGTVGRLLVMRGGKRIAQVPVLPIRLADQLLAAPAEPENPCHDPAADAPLSPDWPDAPLPEDFGEPEQLAAPIPPAPVQPERQTVAGRMFRWQQDRAARELEEPVDDRIDLIRRAARSLATRNPEPAREARPLPGPRTPKIAAIPPLPFAARRAALDGAIRFLGARGVLVSIVDRQAAIRTYRVAGRRDAQLAEGVIEIAAERGFEIPTERTA